MVNGNLIILKKVNDGGILLNDWHSVIITVQAGKISAYMYDKETAVKTISEKTLEVEDYTFVRGSAAIFVNGVKGFYIDEFNIIPNKCWSAWQPRSSVIIKNTNTNIFVEDFKGTLTEKYTIVDVIDSNSRDGPAIWKMTYEDSNLGSYISQTSLVFDISPQKRPSFIINKNKNFCTGIFKSHFEPLQEHGMVSIVFKYTKEIDKSGNGKEEFYTFDMINDNEPTFKFRRWSNGDIKVLYSIGCAQVKGLTKAYKYKNKNMVEIEYVNDRVTIRMSQDGIVFYDVVNMVENTFRCGTVGFGTFKTAVNFSASYMENIKMKLTTGDIDLIINKNFKGIAFSSARKINSLSESLNSVMSLMIKNSSASAYLLSQISIIGSSLGFDLRSDRKASFSASASNSISGSASTSASSASMSVASFNSSSGGWRVCVISRSSNLRKKYCQQSYNNIVFQQKCEVLFFYI